jgi:hypothetical protein
MGIQNPIKLLFMKPFKNTEVESQITYFTAMSDRKDLLPGERDAYLNKVKHLEKRL